MNKEKLTDEFKKRGPWITQFNVGGQKYGGYILFEDDRRIRQFFNFFKDTHSVLELGSLEGGQTFELAKHPNISILAIEGRRKNVERSEFVKQLLDVENIEFVYADLEKTRLTTFGKFDAVFCSGLLYHLPEPWKLIQEIRDVSQKIFIWTHYASEDKSTEIINGYHGLWYQESGIKDPLSGLSQASFWVTISSLKNMLRQHGFTNIEIIEHDEKHPHGPCVTLAAWSDDKNKH